MRLMLHSIGIVWQRTTKTENPIAERKCSYTNRGKGLFRLSKIKKKGCDFVRSGEAKVKSLLENEAEQVIELCSSLVKIPSVNPPGGTCQIASFINEKFLFYGIQSEIVAPCSSKPNVVATIHGNGPGLHLVFNGHMDTFPVPDEDRWSHDPFGGEIEDGRIYGRGAADMKGGLSACIQTVIFLHQLRDLFPGKISITCVSDEEGGGQWGSKYLLKTFPELYGDALINGEPSSPKNVRIGEKGQYWYRISCDTAGGHGAYAGLRPNAIRVLWNFVESLSLFLDIPIDVPLEIRRMMEEARDCYDSLLGQGSTDAALSQSLNIGNIQGGGSVNMIPEHCEAELDFRLPAGVSGEVVAKFVEEKAKDHPDCKILLFNANDASLTEPTHPLVQTMKLTAEEVCKRRIYPTYSLGGTEARLWRRKGIPAVTYGPNHHNMGAPEEYILVDELIDVVKVQTLGAFRYLLNQGNLSRA